ncbi:MAG: response regulator [Bacteroidales bacterium]|nr:response regulator [Bacteroidales bacterium]MBN2761665.1 response regulator [Bacteroidales bacterium]
MNKVQGEPISILLVEDNVDHAHLIMRKLKSFQVANKIIHLEDGEAALQYLKTAFAEHNLPHIILLDLRLPKVDGLEVLRQIKTKPEYMEIPVVILTTSDTETDIAKAYHLHANSYLVKPVNFESFTELMEILGFYWICWNKDPFRS